MIQSDTPRTEVILSTGGMLCYLFFEECVLK